MNTIQRLLSQPLIETLKRGKSILLLGPRQTGKTTLLAEDIQADLNYTLLDASVRQRLEQDPSILNDEIAAFEKLHGKDSVPLVLIDEVQKVPDIMDAVQLAIDQHKARFVLTGSSARKLKRHRSDVNLLPGRVVDMRLDALSLLELPNIPDIKDLLLQGSLPEIILEPSADYKEQLLTSYVNIYLEEEIRAEAIVRNLANFSRFLNYAAIEAGNMLNMSKLSQEIGISRHLLSEYFQILEDCLIADRIEPITTTTSKRRLTKAVKYLFFDLGVRRVAASEGLRLPDKYYGHLFEQFVGVELLKLIRLYARRAKLRYWHDHAGLEVDYVIEYNRQYLPIEVKWTSNPSKADAKHLLKFMGEYDCKLPAYIVCQVSRPRLIYPNVMAIPWQSFADKIKEDLMSLL